MISVFWVPGSLQLLPCGFQNKVSDWQLHVLGVLYEQLSISLVTFKMISIVEHIPTKEPMITQLRTIITKYFFLYEASSLKACDLGKLSHRPIVCSPVLPKSSYYSL